MATLVHDDLVDGARMRRGVPSAWSVFGPRRALSAGDYLFACAFAELAAAEDPRAVDDARRRAASPSRAARRCSAGRRAPGDDDRRLPRAVRPEDREALRGGVQPRLGRRPGPRRLRPRARDRVPDRRRHPRLRRPDAGDGEDPRHRPARGDADDAAPSRGGAGRGRAPRARRRPARGRARPRRGHRRARALARGSARLRREGALVHRLGRRTARSSRPSPTPWWTEPRDWRSPHDTTLELVREKVLAGERLDLEDGLALLESDDLLALGELADLARRVRGGDDRVFFVQNVYLNQTNVCRVKCKFCAFAATQKQAHAYTITPDELSPTPSRSGSDSGYTEIHMVNGESPHVDFDFYRDTIAGPPRGAAGRVPQVLHGLRDPPHDDALGALARGGAARAPGGRPRRAHGRRRRGVRRPRAAARRARQGAPRHLVPRPRHRAPARHPDALHAALRPRRDLRGADRAPAPAARPAGQDGRLPRVHPARVPPGEHGLRAPRLHVPGRAPPT